MTSFTIRPVGQDLKEALQAKIDTKTKPLGALGLLEEITLQVGLIQNSLIPQLRKPHIVVFAADHGIANEGVSAYPQEVTRQMVLNFLNEGAAINVFCRQNHLALTVVDAGVNADLPVHPALIHAKIAKGTKNFLHQPAMTLEECERAIDAGARIVRRLAEDGCNTIGFGDMGIGNTASATVLMHVFTGCAMERCVGRGAGVNDEQFKHKLNILKQAAERHAVNAQDPLQVLSTFGGFEIAMICGGILQAAAQGMVILVDGFIATSAFLAAHRCCPGVLDYALFCHRSDEKGHHEMLHHLNVRPLLDLHMRLGEGTGAALAFPLVQAAVGFLNQMASFSSAGVSEKTPITP